MDDTNSEFAHIEHRQLVNGNGKIMLTWWHDGVIGTASDLRSRHPTGHRYAITMDKSTTPMLHLSSFDSGL